MVNGTVSRQFFSFTAKKMLQTSAVDGGCMDRFSYLKENFRFLVSSLVLCTVCCSSMATPLDSVGFGSPPGYMDVEQELLKDDIQFLNF
jgi:hypothetical protein